MKTTLFTLFLSGLLVPYGLQAMDMSLNQVRQALQEAVNNNNAESVATYSFLLERAQAPALATPAHPLVITQRGDLPIILTAPHGGLQKIAGVPERVNGEKCLDGNTFELAQEINDELFKLTGKRAYFVGAQFGRKYVDANRPANRAYEHAHAKPAYDNYHGHVTESIKDIKRRFPNGAMLLDIHAHGRENNRIYRGTNDRRTVKQLIAKHGEKAFTGPFSILGLLEEQNYELYPKCTQSTLNEMGAYSGGYTVQHYGSHNADGIDAIQLETGWNYRKPETRKAVAKQIAQAISTFYFTYLA